MDIILKSHIARVVLAYLYEQKLNRAAEEFCKASPYLKEERQILKYGSRPTMIFHAKLADLFREYGEIQIKVNNFLEKYGEELNVPSDFTLVKKVDFMLRLAKRGRRSSARKEEDDQLKESAPPPPPTVVGSKRGRIGGLSPQPSLSSSTPELSEPRQKRVRLDRSFIVLNESGGGGRNLSNLEISPITDGESSRDSVPHEEGEQEPGKDGEEEEVEELAKFPSMELFSQTLLGNENYSMKIADLINRELETSTNSQVDPREGPSSGQAQTSEGTPKEQPGENQYSFNFEDLISNIVNNAVKDPVFDGIVEDITSKAIKTQNEKEDDEVEVIATPETPLKERLRKTCKKNYNPASVRKSAKKVKVISDVPFYGTISEVVKSESAVVQPEVSSTEDQPAAALAGTTQFYVIQPDNTTKLMDINQLQFPTQQITIPEASSLVQGAPTLIPFSNGGFSEPTYYLSYYIDTVTQLPVVQSAYPTAFTEPIVNNPVVSISSENSSPEKFLLFPVSSSSGVATVSLASITTTTATSTCATTTTMTASSSSTMVAVQPKPEINTATPQNVIVANPKVKCASTPTRKTSHVRFLKFLTPAKQLTISSPTSAPASVDQRRFRSVIAPKSPPLESIVESETPSTPAPKLIGDWDSVHGLNAITSCSISGTPRVAKDPRSCVRVLSRSASEEDDESACPQPKPTPTPAPAVVTAKPAPKPMVEIPASEVSRKKLSTPSVNDMDLEEWRRIRAVSKTNFDQYLRLVEEEKQQKSYRPPARTKKKQARKSAVPVKLDDSAETTVVEDNSLTEEHAKMLEDALASAKKDAVKTPAKTPAKAKTPKNGDERRQDKIYVKITTPKKRTPAKLTTKRRLSKSGTAAKKKRVRSPRKVAVDDKKEEDTNSKAAEEEDSKESPIEEPTKEDPVTPAEPPKAAEESPIELEREPIKEHTPEEQKQKPRQNADEPVVEFEPANTSNTQEIIEEKPAEVSLNISQLLETPFKLDLETCPVTPRFLVPSQIPITPMAKSSRDTSGCDGPSSTTKACDIQTPNFPITPGLVSTPKSISSASPHSHTGGGFSSRRTDYSSSSSYYRPDESEDLDKNLEAMLIGERKKRPTETIIPKEEPPIAPPPEESPPEQPPPPPTEPPPPEREPDSLQQPRERSPSPAEPASPSSSDSSSSSESSSNSSSSESSPEKEIPPTVPSKSPSPTPTLSKPPQTIVLDARRQQMAELEAKKQRTIARMKNTKGPTPKKKTNKVDLRVKSRNAILAQRDKFHKVVARAPLSQKPTRSNPPAKVPTKVPSTASSKRKNPTPRKLVLMDRAVPHQQAKKHSPKRKPPETRAPRPSLTITDQDLPKIVTPSKDQMIEGTYESENLSRLCYTPDREQESRASKHSEPGDDLESEIIMLPANVEITPDSNKENRSNSNNDDDDDDDENDEEETDEDEYEKCSLRTASEGAGCLQIVYDGKKPTAGTAATSVSPIIKKCNIVIEDRKICLQPQEPFSLFEQAPKKALTSSSSTSKKDTKPSKSSSKKCTGKKTTTTTTSSALPAKAEPQPALVTPSARQSQMEAVRRDGGKKVEGTVKMEPRAEIIDGEKNGTLIQNMTPPSPKMPLKLNMKKSKQVLSSPTTTTTNVVVAHDKSSPTKPPLPPPPSSVPVPPPPPPTTNSIESRRSKEKSQKKQDIREDDDIAMVLTHLHGS